MYANYTPAPCSVCQTPLIGRQRVYCSRTCSALGQRSRVTKVCGACGNTFEVWPAHAASSTWCSMACRSDARGDVARVCKQCGRDFMATRRRVERGRAKFCSSRCYGDSMAGILLMDPVARFWRYVDKTESCWLWTGATEHKGYGVFYLASTRYQAHRYAWEVASGESPQPDALIAHACDVRNCVRNDEQGAYILDGVEYQRYGHLWLGTPAANSADMVAKGRSMKGRRHNVL